VYLVDFEGVEVLSVLDHFGHRVLTAGQGDGFAGERPADGRFRRRGRREFDDHLLRGSIDRHVRLAGHTRFHRRLRFRCRHFGFCRCRCSPA